MIKILMVEDDADVRDSVVEYLRLHGLEAEGVGTARDFLECLDHHPYDIAIIDIGLPDQDGFLLTETLRAHPRLGVIHLSGRSSTEDRIRGFSSGADLYFVKPVDGRELMAAVRTLARRLGVLDEDGEPGDGSPPWVFDLTRWILVPPQGEAISLTSTEVRFLEVLLSAPGKTVSRTMLLAAMRYQNTDAGNRSLEALIRRLRRKVEEATSTRSAIKTVHRQGYLFSAPVIIERS
ncbi:response regulator transcription factor [Pararhodospirillum photometricum]|nr:response regulator transcription factor [Pararhodospirillum photometricum]